MVLDDESAEKLQRGRAQDDRPFHAAGPRVAVAVHVDRHGQWFPNFGSSCFRQNESNSSARTVPWFVPIHELYGLFHRSTTGDPNHRHTIFPSAPRPHWIGIPHIAPRANDRKTRSDSRMPFTFSTEKVESSLRLRCPTCVNAYPAGRFQLLVAIPRFRHGNDTNLPAVVVQADRLDRP